MSIINLHTCIYQLYMCIPSKVGERKLGNSHFFFKVKEAQFSLKIIRAAKFELNLYRYIQMTHLPVLIKFELNVCNNFLDYNWKVMIYHFHLISRGITLSNPFEWWQNDRMTEVTKWRNKITLYVPAILSEEGRGEKIFKFQPLTMCNRTGGMSLASTQDLSILKTNIPPT